LILEVGDIVGGRDVAWWREVVVMMMMILVLDERVLKPVLIIENQSLGKFRIPQNIVSLICVID